LILCGKILLTQWLGQQRSWQYKMVFTNSGMSRTSGGLKLIAATEI
jgi:hypothetical protein